MNTPDLLIGLNPDVNKRKTVIRLIKANNGYCISQPGKSQDTKCHCKRFKETGECLCGLFLTLQVVEIEP